MNLLQEIKVENKIQDCFFVFPLLVLALDQNQIFERPLALAMGPILLSAEQQKKKLVPQFKIITQLANNRYNDIQCI